MKIDKNNLKDVEYLLKYYREGYKALKEELELLQADVDLDSENKWFTEKLASWDSWLSSTPESFSIPLTLLTDGLKKAFLSYPNLTDEELNDAAVDTLTNPVNYDEVSDCASSNSIWDEVTDPCSGWDFESFDDDFEDDYPTFEEMIKEGQYSEPATKDVVINITVPANTTVELTIKTSEVTPEPTVEETTETTKIDPLGWYNEDYEDEYEPQVIYADSNYFGDESERGYADEDDYAFLNSPFGPEIKDTFDEFWATCLPERNFYYDDKSTASNVSVTPEEKATSNPEPVEEPKSIEEHKAVEDDIPEHLTTDCDPDIDLESLLSAITTAAALRYKEVSESSTNSDIKEKLASTLKQADLSNVASLALKGMSKALSGVNGSLKNILDEMDDKDSK